MYLADVYTVAPALAGLPALSLPCGLSSAGLPIGLQMIAPPLAETTLIRTGAAYQTISDHHRREPDWAALGSALTRLSEEGAK
jgi:aspartyl-tRNA(Asn)/glutamyl-tRNA(Gln) amidotransferase subunit A